MSQCTDLFAHAINAKNMSTVGQTAHVIHKLCTICGYSEHFPRSKRNVAFVNPELLHTKVHAHDQLSKELLQPTLPNGNINEEFTEAYGYNPLDPATKHKTPKILGGLKE